MIHELRIYHCVPGRLPALLKRFDTITLAIWERHGIRQAGFWTTEIGPSNQDLYYLLESDPEWIAKRAETEKDGAIVATLENIFLKPTAFSKVK